jgi:predicted amidophosphoribosyltransferase
MTSAPALLEMAERYKQHNDLVRLSQLGLTAAEAGVKTGKECAGCQKQCYPWERYCKPCGKARRRAFVALEDQLNEAREEGAIAVLVTKGGGR